MDMCHWRDNTGNAGYTIASSFLYEILSSTPQFGLLPLLDFFAEKCSRSSTVWI